MNTRVFVLGSLVLTAGCKPVAGHGAPAAAPAVQEGTCGESTVPVDDWAAIVAGYQGKVRSVPRSAPEACTAANRIVTMCPSYDTKMVETREQVCAEAVREDIASVEASMSTLSMKLPAMKGLGEPQEDLWENGDARSLPRSVARLEAIKPVAPANKALFERVALLRKEAAEMDEARAAATAAPGGCAGFQGLQARVREIESTCKVERRDQRTCPLIAAIFSGELERRRQLSVGEPTRKIRKIIGENPDLEAAQDLAPFNGAVTLVRDLLGEMKCFEPPGILEWEPELVKWASEREAAIESEKKCRRTPSCMAARAAAKARAAAAAAAASGGTVGGCTCRDGAPGCCGRGCCSGHGGISR